MIYLFDIDGTILLTGGAGYRALDRLFVERYDVAGATEGVSAGGKTDPVIVAEVIARALARSAHPGEVDSLIDAYVPMLEQEISASANFCLMPSVVECLDFLATAEDVVLGLATGNVELGARAKLCHANLWDRFRFGGYGCDSADRSELVAAAIRRGREAAGRAVPNEDIVVVGDTTRDIDAARACGVQVVAVATGPSTDRQTLASAQPDALFDTLAELPSWHRARF